MQLIKKHIILLLTLLLLFAGGFASEIWGNTTEYKDAKLNTSPAGTWGLLHGYISISGGSYASGTKDWKLCSLKNGNTQTFDVTWGSNAGSSISVSKITFAMVGYGTGSQVKAKFNDNDYTNIGNLAEGTRDVSITNPSSGLTLTVYCSASVARDIRIKKITVEYTITPDAPEVNPTTRTVNVTLPSNTSSPTTVNYSSCFSTSDATDYTPMLQYAFASNPNNKGVLNNGNFYATEAGTYTVYAYIAAKNDCHVQSANSSNLTITVNRLNPTITYRDTTIDVSVNSTDDKIALNLDNCRTSYTGNSNTFTYTKTSGDAAGVVSENTFYATKIGDYTIKATANKTGQYKSVETTFMVHVRKRANTLALVSGPVEEFVDNDITSVITSKNSNVSLETNSSDATIAYFDVANKKIVIPNSEAKSFTSRDITISIWQATNDFYEASGTKTLTVRVKKYPTSFTGSAYNLMVDGVQTADYSYTNTSTAQPTANSADNFYYTIDNVSFTNPTKNNGGNLVTFNPSNKQIAACNAGTGRITLHQKETYKYTGATTFAVCDEALLYNLQPSV